MNKDFSKDLLDWYDRHQRTLPWRAKSGVTADPYHVWLSEIMLQQTTVATVKAYFEKFLRLWPSVENLAAAPLDSVLKEWAGLGYYARARNLHKCAGVIVNDHNGTFPETEAALRSLPGIGDYTAAAIIAIAFNRHAAVVDGNIERIIARCYRISTPLPTAKKPIREVVEGLTPNTRPGDFAQAMMDLGASHCSPKKPSCMLCPLPRHCEAHKTGDMENYPVKAPKKEKPTRRAISFWLVHDGHLLLERRPPKGLLGGMPGLFSTPWVERPDFPVKTEWLEHTPTDDYWKPVSGMAKHTFTHFHLLTQLVTAKARARHNVENGFWHPIEDLANIGLPTAYKKIADLML
ncbi:A/G-specific adenine glycosylase [Kordiimonas pumila]|uniref:Adenine DNA glycosylase n=1 Tax=Kordiimonas pumila TaxID=2161677 RepID=A0ABV7D8C9_9PROT|nr:A/G-specific adenine glycosylase [Kordiimonas pumila]